MSNVIRAGYLTTRTPSCCWRLHWQCWIPIFITKTSNAGWLRKNSWRTWEERTMETILTKPCYGICTIEYRRSVSYSFRLVSPCFYLVPQSFVSYWFVLLYLLLCSLVVSSYALVGHNLTCVQTFLSSTSRWYSKRWLFSILFLYLIHQILTGFQRTCLAMNWC